MSSKKHIGPCEGQTAFNFDCNIFKHDSIQDRHKKIGQVRISAILYNLSKSYLLLSAKTPISNLIWGKATSVLIATMQIFRTGIKSRTSSNFGHIVQISELLALECFEGLYLTLSEA